jgi:hypothetical protein
MEFIEIVVKTEDISNYFHLKKGFFVRLFDRMDNI